MLLINDGTEYVFVNLFEDEVFDEFNDIVNTVFKKVVSKLRKVKLVEVINNIFGISCDSIDGKEIDTSLKDENALNVVQKNLKATLLSQNNLLILKKQLLRMICGKI